MVIRKNLDHYLEDFSNAYLRCVCGFECKSLDELIIHYSNPVSSTQLRNIQQQNNSVNGHFAQLTNLAKIRQKKLFR